MWQKIVLKLEQGKKYIVELIDQSTVSVVAVAEGEISMHFCYRQRMISARKFVIKSRI